MTINLKKVTSMILGFNLVMSLGITAKAQQNNLTDRLKNLSARVNELVQINADYMTQADQREVLELLRQVRDKVKPGSSNQPPNQQPPQYPGNGISETQSTGAVSRKSNGDWITLRLNRPVVLTQITIHALGSSKVRIYKVLAISLNNQSTNLNINSDLGAGNNVTTSLANTSLATTHIQILAEAWSNDMSLVIDTLGFQQGQNGTEPPIQYPPHNPDTGIFYCMAACKKSNGNPNLSYVGGGKGQFQSQAETAAVDNLTSQFNCSYGATITECSRENSRLDYHSFAACTKPDGSAKLSSIGDFAAAPSSTESKTKALISLRSRYNCSYDSTVVASALSDNRTAYCTAACTDASGLPNLSRLKGAEGRSIIEAKANAIKALNAAFNCSYDVVIHKCEQ